jgi:hypothetical protein
MERTRINTRYRFEPALIDRISGPGAELEPGTIVRTTQPYGCPKNNTMNHSYVEHLDGRFIGLVCNGSLQPERDYEKRS